MKFLISSWYFELSKHNHKPQYLQLWDFEPANNKTVFASCFNRLEQKTLKQPQQIDSKSRKKKKKKRKFEGLNFCFNSIKQYFGCLGSLNIDHGLKTLLFLSHYGVIQTDYFPKLIIKNRNKKQVIPLHSYELGLTSCNHKPGARFCKPPKQKALAAIQDPANLNNKRRIIS